VSEHDNFTDVINSVFRDQLKKRAYMMSFPGELIPPVNEIDMGVEYRPYIHAVGYHDSEPEVLRLHIDGPDKKCAWLEGEDLAQFLREFFGAE
jgi:hypothetical protein